MFFSNDSLSKSDIPIYSQLSESHVLEISSDFSVTHKVTRKLLILSNEGLNHGRVVLGYDKLRQVNSFQAEIIDPKTGKSLKKFRLKDLPDLAQYSEVNLYDDNRIKYFQPNSSVFPVQLEISYELKSSTNFVLPTWVPVPNYHQEVLASSFSVTFPESMGLKYKEQNLISPKTVSQVGENITWEWTATNLPVQKKDFPKEDDHRLFLAPVQFGMQGYRGQMNDWAGLSKWQFELNAGRDGLPEGFRNQIRELTKEANTDFEKIQLLYSHLQKNFRYVSIQLGIGGWQSTPAEDVLKSSYGDCKGLTNLMKAMLKEVGIESQEALVLAGVEEEDIEVDLVSQQFNHVILRAQADGNPVWLECTSSTLPAGFLGDFTKNRHVLLIQETGGQLIKTPSYRTKEWNHWNVQGQIHLDAQGNAKIKNDLQYSGNPVETILDVKSKLDERQQRDFLNRNSSISGLLVDTFQITLDQRDSIPFSKISYEGFIQRFSQNTAKRVLLKPFFLKIKPDHLNNQSLDLNETYEILLADNWDLEGGLPFQEESGEFFSGFLRGEQQGNRLLLSRGITIELPEDCSEDQKTELIKKINTSLDRVFSFSKPTLTDSQ